MRSRSQELLLRIWANSICADTAIEEVMAKRIARERTLVPCDDDVG